MLNSTILSKISWVASLLANNAILTAALGIALIILFWLLATFKYNRNMLRRQQRQLKPTLEESPREEASREEAIRVEAPAAVNAAEPTPPRAAQAFAQLNPIQSVERQKRKRHHQH